MTASLREAPVDASGVVWHARTVPELADATRFLAGQIRELQEAPVVEPPDLSGYVPRAEFDALAADVVVLQSDVEVLAARVAALEAAGTPAGTTTATRRSTRGGPNA